MLKYLFISHLHPLLVHLPIGIFLLAFLLEIVSRNPKQQALKPAISFSLLIAAISALLSALTGWLIPKTGDYDPQLVNLHFWLGISLTVCLSVLYLASRPAFPLRRLYLPLFLLNLLLLLLTGHLGGSLTHGSDYLWKSDTEALPSAERMEDIYLFEQVIMPILTQKCSSCHNPEKRKGELLLTGIEGMQQGGKSGALYLPHDPAHSLIIERLELPLTEKKHMPPKGKQPLSHEEISLLKWWINAGAAVDQQVGEMEISDELRGMLAKYTSQAQGPTDHLEAVEAGKLQAIRALGILLNPQDEAGIRFEASMAYDSSITRQKLQALQQIKAHISQLNLAFSNLDDDLAKEIGAFPHLQKLDLQHSRISSAALDHLTALKYLQSLNLYGTAVDDEGLVYLGKMKALERVYLWQSQSSREAILAFEKAHPGIQVSYQVDMNLFGEAQLKAPVFGAEKNLFKDSMEVTLAMNFKGVNIFYTLDGSLPDTHAQLYTAPFYIHQTREIQAIAQKPGWQTSELAKQVYIQTKYSIAEIRLSVAPNEKYRANGAKSLTDFVRGGKRFSEGGWLGFEGQHLTATLDMGEMKAISSVTVGALEDVGSYIFYPRGIKVSVSTDGHFYQKIAQKDIPVASEAHPAEISSFLLQFSKTSARYVKVEIKSNLKNPAWHPAPGAKCWIFVDEVLVN